MPYGNVIKVLKIIFLIVQANVFFRYKYKGNRQFEIINELKEYHSKE